MSSHDPLTQTLPSIIKALYHLLIVRICRYLRAEIPLQQKLLLALAIWIALCGGAQAEEQKMPEGMKGWWYFITIHKSGYARTPWEACALTAANHWGTPLEFMKPSALPKAIYECFYANPFRGKVSDYTHTHLDCEPLHSPQAPGICVKWAEAPKPPTCSPGETGFALGNPVAIATGAKIQTETDISGAPNGTLRISRTYRSLRAGGSGQSAGQGWSLSFDRAFDLRLSLLPRETTPMGVTGTFGDGTQFEFFRLDSGVYISTLHSRETLRNLNGAFTDWELTRRDGSIERFRKINGKYLLLSSHTKEGTAQFYSYTPDNKLASIADAAGRGLQVTWAGDVVASIASATGSVRYGYELVKAEDNRQVAGTERLATVDFLDAAGQLIATRRYHYEDPNYRHLLTGITDENGRRFATYAYSESGQTVLSEHAGGANRFEFAYPEKEKRVITDPLGTQREFALDYGSFTGGLVSSVNQPGGAGCGPGSSKQTYDEDGRLATSTDFNDRKSCFITEKARGLVTSEVIGLSTGAACPASGTQAIAASSRRISTQWHPDVELETATASAKLITRYVYNGQAGADGVVASCAASGTLPGGKPIIVLCSKTLQGTSDPNGVSGFTAKPEGRPRTWRYSYNASGQLLKSTGPTDAFGQMESFSNTYYDDATASHAVGDLATTRNAMGEETKFLEYTKDGRPSKIQRANGVTDNLVYGARGRIDSSTTVGSKGGKEMTLYSYDEVGQLTGIVAPDGSTVILAYDEAHRLISLTDGAGNQVQLTLDNAGNVTREELRNASGALVKVSNSAFDALNRLESVQRGMQQASTLQYDRGGNVRSETDPLGRVTTAEFDNLDRLTKAVQPPALAGKPATTTSFGYDQQDSLVSVIDPRKLTTRYTRDGYGQQTALSSPDTNISRNAFDDAGNLVSRRDGRGAVTAYRYDAAGRVTNIGSSIFEYGKGGSSAAGRLNAMIDESGKSSFAYDEFGRLQEQVHIVGTGGAAKQFSVGYKYGASGGGTGHVTSMTYPSGNRIDVAYGVNGQPTGITLMAQSAAAPIWIMSNIEYSALGTAQDWTWGSPAGKSVYRREFDLQGRLVSYPLGPIGAGGALRT